MEGHSVSPDTNAVRTGWLDVLDRMEADLAADAATFARASYPIGTEWSAPAHLGPMPIDLTDRAARILAAQRLSIRRLLELQRVAGQHLEAIHSIPSAQRTDQSVYLDVTG